MSQLQPGDHETLWTGAVECCVVFRAQPFCVAWSVTPARAAKIDRATGELTVAGDATDGTDLEVKADVDGGRSTRTRTIHIYDRKVRPFIGHWYETAVLDCSTGKELVPAEPIGSVDFAADGRFVVTVHPLEIRYDYAGDAVFDPSKHTVKLTPKTQERWTADFVGNGTYTLDGPKRLILKGINFGTFRDGPIKSCGHVLERAGGE